MPDNDRMRALITGAERLGVIGSPSSTSQLALDIMARAATRKLVASWRCWSFPRRGPPLRSGADHEIELRNISGTRRPDHAQSDPATRSGGGGSERQDTHLGKMTISAAFKQGEGTAEPSILGTVPATGRRCMVTDEILNEVLSLTGTRSLPGRVWSRPKLPSVSSTSTVAAGRGEAYHVGISERQARASRSWPR